jgi:hypothetical protein
MSASEGSCLRAYSGSMPAALQINAKATAVALFLILHPSN